MADWTVVSEGPQTFGSRPAANRAASPAIRTRRADRSSTTSAKTFGSGGRGIGPDATSADPPRCRVSPRGVARDRWSVDERVPARRRLVGRDGVDRDRALLGAADERQLEREA